MTTTETGLLGPGDGEAIELAGAHILTKITAAQTEGRYALVEVRNEPGWGSELNRHPHENKVFYVLAGTYEFVIDARWGDVHPGDTLLVRAGAIHGFRAGSGGGRVLVVYPGGSANWFADAAAAGGSARHGTSQHAALHERTTSNPWGRSPCAAIAAPGRRRRHRTERTAAIPAPARRLTPPQVIVIVVAPAHCRSTVLAHFP